VRPITLYLEQEAINLNTFCVTYDLSYGSREDYAQLEAYLKENHKTWWHGLESTWFIVTAAPVGEVRDRCKRVAPAGSQMLVFDVGRGWAGAGFSDRAYEWLRKWWDVR